MTPILFVYLSLIWQLCMFVCLRLNPVQLSSNLWPVFLTVFVGLVLLVHPFYQHCIGMHLLVILGHHHWGPSPPPSS